MVATGPSTGLIPTLSVGASSMPLGPTPRERCPFLSQQHPVGLGVRDCFLTEDCHSPRTSVNGTGSLPGRHGREPPSGAVGLEVNGGPVMGAGTTGRCRFSEETDEPWVSPSCGAAVALPLQRGV